MICKNCGNENPNKSKYCNNCGAVIEKNENPASKYHDNENDEKDNEMENRDDYIYDRKKYKLKSKSKSKGFLLKLVLILTLLLVFIFSFYVVQIASDTNNKRIVEKEKEREREIEREEELKELKKLEEYENKFVLVLDAFEKQKDYIDLSLKSVTNLKLNKFGKNLKFGNSFNDFINKVFDNSSVTALVDQSETIEILMKELESPPESYESKYKNIVVLHNIEKKIKDEFYPELNKDAKENVETFLDEYKVALFSLKGN